MKKLLLLLALLAPASLKADETFYTPAAMACMREERCTEGITKLSADNYSGEAKEILSNLDMMGVKVFKAIPQYFVEEYRGVYYSDDNNIFLNARYTRDHERFLKILRHEGWHAAQDCMAGGMHNSELLGIYSHEDIPEHIIEETFARYGYHDPETIRIEREAVWVMYEPWMTVEALTACNSDAPMWETYFPPKETWRWLYWNGHI